MKTENKKIINQIAVDILSESYYQNQIAADYGKTLRDAGYSITTASIKKAMDIIKTKRQTRANKALYSLSLKERLKTRLVTICQQQITERGLDTPTGWAGHTPSITHYSPVARLWIVHSEYKYHYSNRFGDWWTGASYLCGRDEGQYFAIRLPRTITNIDRALDWITPAQIKQAEEKGLPVKRQGDIFFRPMQIKNHDMSALRPTRHDARPRKDGGLTIVHPQHKPVILSGKYRWRAYQTTQVSGNHRAAAD